MSNNPYSLEGKRILITGATSGIGYATAVAIADLNGDICAIGRNSERMNKLVSELTGKTNILPYICDINDSEQVLSVINQLPLLDGIVFGAGTINTVSARHISRDKIDNIFETNFFSTIRLCTLLLSHKLINNNSSLIFISSIASDCIAEPGMAIYSSSKSAICAYARVLALELSKKHIRVNCIKPGMVKTPLINLMKLTPNDLASDEHRYPLGYGEPKDVAYGITYLLSDAAKWVTGSELTLDGGRTLR